MELVSSLHMYGSSTDGELLHSIISSEFHYTDALGSSSYSDRKFISCSSTVGEAPGFSTMFEFQVMPWDSVSLQQPPVHQQCIIVPWLLFAHSALTAH